MPPKARITREIILNTVLELTKETGFEAVNARSIAGRLQCSTQPIFTCYESMDELKKDFLAYAYAYYERYVSHYRNSVTVSPVLILPLSYIQFAREETHLFQMLFINDMDLKMAQAKDFYNEADNEKRAEIFSVSIGVELQRAKAIFLDLFLYTHGIAVLTAAKKLTLDQNAAEEMVKNVLSALIKQEKADGL